MTTNRVTADDFELQPIDTNVNGDAGPSRPTPIRAGKAREPRHPSSSVLFKAPETALPSSGPKRPATPQSPLTPIRRHSRAQFLEDEVHVPDLGHLLGITEEDDHFTKASRMTSRWKQRLYLLMEEPSSSREAFYVHLCVTGAILVSTVLTTLSTLPTFHTDSVSARTLFGLDTMLVILFTVEYGARLAAHSDSWRQVWRWVTSFLPLVDLLSILPFYIEVALQDDTADLMRWSILRVFRLLRVFRSFAYHNSFLLTIEVMYVAIQRSKEALLALAFFEFVIVVLFSTLIYFAERGTWDSALATFVTADGDPSQFNSIPASAFFVLETIATVGYGDIVAQSFLGRLFTAPLLLFGLLLIALPSYMLSKNFSEVYNTMNWQHPPEQIGQKVGTTAGTTLGGSDSHFQASVMSTPRISIDTRSTPMLDQNPVSGPILPVAETPLLPNSGDPIPRRPSPFPSVGHPHPSTRMWDGDLDYRPKEKDLTNIKLAKNQMVRGLHF